MEAYMKSEFRLVYQGQSENSEQNRASVVSILQEQYGIGKIFEVDYIVDNPPFVVKRSIDRSALEAESKKLKVAGAQTLIVQTVKNTQALAKSIETLNPFKSFYQEYAEKLNKILLSVDVKKVEELGRAFIAARDRKSQIIFIGNGGSAAAASHMATDLAKQRFSDEKYLFRVMSLADNLPWFSATANDFGYENVFVQQLKNILQPNDVVVAISSSGNSPNVLKAIEYANSKGAQTFGVVGFDGGKLIETAQKSIYIPTKKGQYGYMEDVSGILGHMLSIFIYECDNDSVKCKK